MASLQQRPNLGRRIVGSAKGLACSTLSGVSGIEVELRDPLNNLTSGKVLAAPRPSGPHVDGSVPKARKATPEISAAAGIRGDFTKDIDLDPEFEAFAKRMESVACVPKKSVRFETRPARKAVLVCDFSRRQSQSGSYEMLYGSSPESVMRGLSWRQAEANQYTLPNSQWSSTNDGWNDLSLNTETMNTPKAILLGQPTMESTWARSQSAAVERLRQFNNQLTEAATAPPVTWTSQQDWIPGNLHWEEIQNEQMRQNLRVPERRLQHERLDTSEQKHSLMRNFYCRRLSCHRRLVMQEASPELDYQTRCCVHSGCGYVSDTIAGWERHCAVEHNHMEESDGEDSSCEHC